MAGHSTIHNLIEAVDQTYIALEHHKINCQVFCDISKAFDRVCQRGLILKLEKYRIRGLLLAWFEITYILFFIQIYNSWCTARVRPWIYINDITGIACLFADDTSLSLSSVDPVLTLKQGNITVSNVETLKTNAKPF